MTETPKSFSDLVPIALEARRAEYQELMDNWRNLDAKAQGLGAIAGVFAAALLAGASNVPAHLSTGNRLGLFFIAILLFVSIASAAYAMWLMKRTTPPLRQTAKMVDDLLRPPEEGEDPEDVSETEAVRNFLSTLEGLWSEANNEILDTLKTKTTPLYIGQGALVFAALIALVLVAVNVLPGSEGAAP